MHHPIDKIIVILWFVYKEGIEDMSDSPWIYICEQLVINENIMIRVYDLIKFEEIITDV